MENYKNYLRTEIELFPIKNKHSNFITIKNEETAYFHIFFNDNENEIGRNHISEENNVSKIKIIIDYQIKNFSNLFYYVQSIEKINFIRFYRKDITDMRNMFFYCSSLKELNLSNFNTDNVTDMSYMFYNCSSLK